MSKTFGPNGDRYSTAVSAAIVKQHQITKRVSAVVRVHAFGRTRIENGKQNPTTKLGAESSSTRSSVTCLNAGRRTSCVSGRRTAGASASVTGIQFRFARQRFEVVRLVASSRHHALT